MLEAVMHRLRFCLPLLGILLAVQILAQAQTQTPPDPKRLAITKSVMDNFARGAIPAVRERFGADLKNSVSEKDLRDVRDNLGIAAGLFRAQISQTGRNVQGIPVYLAKSQYERFKVELRLTFDDMNMVTGFRISPVSDLAPEVMEANAKGIADLLQQKHFDQVTAKFNDQMQQVMPTAQLAGSWEHVVTHLGPFKSIRSARKDPESDQVNVRCEFELGPMIIRIAYEPSGRIAGLWMLPAEPETGSQI
jgi:hypothetical protein